MKKKSEQTGTRRQGKAEIGDEHERIAREAKANLNTTLEPCSYYKVQMVETIKNELCKRK